MPDYRLGRLRGGWVVVWYEGARRKRWRLAASNVAEARAAFREFVKERDALRRPQEQLTVADIWADYVAEKEAAGKVSIGRMKDAWKALRPKFGHERPEGLTPLLVREYTHERRKSVGDGTIHTELGYLRACLRHAKCRADFSLPAKPRPKSRHLTPEEARRLIDAATMPHVRLFIQLSLYTAGRPSSILDLEWSRVDLLRGIIHLDNPARDRTAKGRASVPIAGFLKTDLERASKNALSAYVIEWAGEPVKSVKKGIAAAARRAGLKGVTPYVLRHSAAVFMAEAGVPMEEIAQFMGHTSPAITFRTYARYSPEYLRRAGDAISTALLGHAEPKAVNGE